MTLTREAVQKELDSIEDIREKIDRMNEVCRDIYKVDSKWGEELAEQAQEYSKKAGYPRGEAFAIANKGSFLGLQSRYDASNDYLKKASGILRELPADEQRGLNKVLLGLGGNLTDQERYTDAALIFREALNLSETWGDVKVAGQIYSQLAVISGTLGRLSESRDYLLKAVDILEHTTFYDDLVFVLNNLGYVYNLQGLFKKALKTLKRGEKLVKKHNLTVTRVVIVCTIMKVYLNMEEYDNALKMYIKNKEAIRNDKRPLNISYIMLHLATLFEKKEDFKRALKYAVRARKIIISNDLNFIKKDMYYQFYRIYKKLNSFKRALFYYEAYVEHEKLNADKEISKNTKNVEADSLREANKRIAVISETGQNITSSLNLNSVLDRIYTSVNRLMDAPFFGIVVYDRHAGILSYEMYIENGESLPQKNMNFDEKRSLAAYAIRNKKDIIINDLANEYNHYIPGQEPQVLGDRLISQSALFVPLRAGDEINGVITAQSDHKNAYSLYDLEALKALASYIAIAINNARQSELIQQQNKELHAFHQKTKTDLLMARKLQLEMIPTAFPRSLDYSMYGYYHPIDELGGDLYDVYRISEDKTAVFILDVVGHGVYSALITAMAKVLFNKSREDSDAASIVEAVNREITPITSDSFTYFSLFFAIIDSNDHSLEYVNAAHPEPILVKEDGNFEYLSSSSLYIGLKGDYRFEQKTISLHPGDRLVLYTDGFFELHGPGKSRFGEKRMLDLLIKTRAFSPEKAIFTLNEEIKIFQEGCPQTENDDRAMLMIDFHG